MKAYIWNKIPLEYFFLVIGLYFGMRLVFVNPPWQTNDEDRHFYVSWYYANGYLNPVVQGKTIGNPMPVKLFNQVQGFQGIRFNAETKINKQSLKKNEAIIYNKNQSFFYDTHGPLGNPVGYIPFVIGIKLGEMYKQNAIIVHWWARAFGLFAYLLIVFYAIRIVPVYKNVLMLLALTPMSLYQASSVTYDTLCNASTLLIIAFVVKWLLQKDKVTIKELSFFFLAFIVQVFSKSGYYFIPLLVLIVPSEKFHFSFPKIKLTAIVLAVILLPSITWDLYIKSLDFPAVPHGQNDFKFNFGLNLAFQLQNIPGMISNLWGNILYQGKDWIIGCIGRFGYSYTQLPHNLVFAYVVCLLGVASVDSNSGCKITLMQRGISALLLLASVGSVIAGVYLMGSPIGSNLIFGLQGRYFIPILPLLLFQLFCTIPLSEKKKKFIPLFTVLISVFFLYKTIAFIEATFY